MTALEIRREANRLTVALPNNIRAEVMAMTPQYRVKDVVLFGTETQHPEVMVLFQNCDSGKTYVRSYYGRPSITWDRGPLIDCTVKSHV